MYPTSADDGGNLSSSSISAHSCPQQSATTEVIIEKRGFAKVQIPSVNSAQPLSIASSDL
ncbi:hypothetical protein HanPI659440_Chr03g0098161 [Helianthus annuus]|nr:hypothetical protein HanPI659440_Chr03g0098161 [Helianthus annuus]